jgi:hypothetical protein
MMRALVQAFIRREVDRIDRAALWWLVRRTDLPRDVMVALLEWAARELGARVELQDLGAGGPA